MTKEKKIKMPGFRGTGIIMKNNIAVFGRDPRALLEPPISAGDAASSRREGGPVFDW